MHFEAHKNVDMLLSEKQIWNDCYFLFFIWGEKQRNIIESRLIFKKAMQQGKIQSSNYLGIVLDLW